MVAMIRRVMVGPVMILVVLHTVATKGHGCGRIQVCQTSKYRIGIWGVWIHVVMDRFFSQTFFLDNILKKGVLGLYFLSITGLSLAQSNSTSGTIIYDVYEGNYTNEVGPENFIGVRDYSANIDDYSPKSILLKFKGDISYCKQTVESTVSNNNWSKFKESSLELIGETFFSVSDKELLNTYYNDGELYLISKNIGEIQWELREGVKTVLGHECKKAVRQKKYARNGRSWVVDYVAWYTPEIDVPFGPFDHINLPGLVMKIEKHGGHTEFNYVARIIELDKNDSMLIEKPTKGIPITQKEYDKKLRERLETLFGKN